MVSSDTRLPFMQLLARRHSSAQAVALAHARKHAAANRPLRGSQSLTIHDANNFCDGFAAASNYDFFASLHCLDIARKVLICVPETDLLFHWIQSKL